MTFPFRIPPTKSQSNGVQILSASISGLDSSRDFMVDRLGICDQASATHWNESRVICRREEYETGSTATTRCVAYQRPSFPFLGSLRLQEVAAIIHSPQSFGLIFIPKTILIVLCHRKLPWTRLYLSWPTAKSRCVYAGLMYFFQAKCALPRILIGMTVFGTISGYAVITPVQQ
jgi:hypothetical protein